MHTRHQARYQLLLSRHKQPLGPGASRGTQRRSQTHSGFVEDFSFPVSGIIPFIGVETWGTVGPSHRELQHSEMQDISYCSLHERTNTADGVSALCRHCNHATPTLRLKGSHAFLLLCVHTGQQYLVSQGPRLASRKPNIKTHR